MRKFNLIAAAIAVLFFISGCGAEWRVNYRQHPELAQAKKDFGTLYDLVVEAGINYYGDDDELHEYLTRQTTFMYRTRYLTADSTPYFFPELTSASALEVFQAKYLRMADLQQQEPPIPGDGSPGPILNWEELYQAITVELAKRNERVREMNAKIEAARRDSIKAPSPPDSLLPGFSVMPTR